VGFYAYSTAFGPLSGFGFVGQGIVGDVGFDTNYADTYWRYRGLGAPYTPPSDALLNSAKLQWQKLQELIDASAPSEDRAAARLKKLRDDLTYYVQTIEGWVTERYDFAHERADYFLEMNVVRVYNGINSALKTFADEDWPEAYEEIEAADAAAKAATAAQKADADALKAAQTKADADAATVQAGLQQTQDAVAQAKAAIAAAKQAEAIAEASAQKNRQLQALAMKKSALVAERAPWVVAGLAALTVGAIFLARRGKSAKTAGYRRRR
jgi:hypothetical protein